MFLSRDSRGKSISSQFLDFRDACISWFIVASSIFKASIFQYLWKKKKNPPAMQGRSPGEGKVFPLQYSGLENSVDCIVQGVTKSQTWLSDRHFHFHLLRAFVIKVSSLRKPFIISTCYGQLIFIHFNSICKHDSHLTCDITYLRVYGLEHGHL